MKTCNNCQECPFTIWIQIVFFLLILCRQVGQSSSSSADRLDNPPLKLLLSPQTSICVTSLAKALGSSAPEACQLLLVRNAWEVFLMILRECFPTIQMFRVTTPCDHKRTGLPCPGQQSPALSGCKILDTNL